MTDLLFTNDDDFVRGAAADGRLTTLTGAEIPGLPGVVGADALKDRAATGLVTRLSTDAVRP